MDPSPSAVKDFFISNLLSEAVRTIVWHVTVGEFPSCSGDALGHGLQVSGAGAPYCRIVGYTPASVSLTRVSKA